MKRRTVTVLFLLVYAGLRSSAEPGKITRLSLRLAIEMALSPGTASSQLSALSVESARGKVIAAKIVTSLVAQAAVSDRVFRVDLRALGIDIPRFSELISTIQLPNTPGPYTLLDPHIQAAKTLIDKAAKRKVLAEKAGVEEAKSVVVEDREKIAAETARLYFDAARASALVELAGANLNMAETMQRFAEERHAQGLAAESEMRKAKIGANDGRQKLLDARLEQTRSILRLLYLLGGDYGDTLELTDPLESRSPTVTLEQAIDEALKNNPRLLTIQRREDKLKLNDAAISAAWLPVVSAFGEFGMDVVAPDPSNAGSISHAVVFAAGVEAKIPVLDGHRRALAHAQVLSEMRGEQIRLRDLQRQIELDVRLAYASLHEATERVNLAAESLAASEADVIETKAARAAGNASGLELQQAEARSAAAADGRIAAVHLQAQARLALAQAMGNVAGLNW